MNFLHCNCCGHLPAFGEDRTYFLTSCGHVLCDPCSKRTITGASTCLVCKVPCRLADLTNHVKPEIKEFFTDPLQILKGDLNKLAKVAQFQQSQNKRFVSQVVKIGQELKKVRSERDALRDRLTTLDAENLALKKKLESIEQREQDWIGAGVMRSPRGGGNGFFVAPPSPLFDQSERKRPCLTSYQQRGGNNTQRQPVINLNGASGSGRISRPNMGSNIQGRNNLRDGSGSGSGRFRPNSNNGGTGSSVGFNSPSSGSTISGISLTSRFFNSRIN